MSSSTHKGWAFFEREYISRKRLVQCDFQSLRPIAQRQILSLIRRLVLTDNKELYLSEIHKILEFEQEVDPK